MDTSQSNIGSRVSFGVSFLNNALLFLLFDLPLSLRNIISPMRSDRVIGVCLPHFDSFFICSPHRSASLRQLRELSPQK